MRTERPAVSAAQQAASHDLRSPSSSWLTTVQPCSWNTCASVDLPAETHRREEEEGEGARKLGAAVTRWQRWQPWRQRRRQQWR